ncbi:response regulator transcription factor [Nocardioides speluncae]|uniref:response regulator transcription factor n=1 Tax=Nocardioides speluncae TaxID=2670337 RepID=UPI001980ED11|nr:response regulator transcription factor [Nocardioides speluncae]
MVDDLVRARDDYERGDWTAALGVWSGADADQLGATELFDAATAAFLLGRREESQDLLQDCFRRFEENGDVAGTVRCAFRLAMTYASGGEPALSAGWGARAQRLLESSTEPVVESGYVAFLQMFGHLSSARWADAAEAAARAVAVGRAFADPDLLALGTCSEGRLAIYGGRVADGVALLDESMVSVLAGETGVLISGHVYCTAIEGVQEIGDLGRVAEWTRALHHWCTRQPELVAFTGQCSLHRAQVMRLRGAWPEALDELDRSISRYRQMEATDAIGLAAAERGDLLRLLGRYDGAAASYELASAHGYDPQPGLAQLWAARGGLPAAVAAVRRALAEAAEPVRRIALLPGAVEVLLAAGEVEPAAEAATELDELARRLGSSALLARAAFAAAAVELARDDAAGALPYLRNARRLWAQLDGTFEVARVGVLTARALARLGDAESGQRELDAACAALTSLGAEPALAEASRAIGAAGTNGTPSAELPGGLTAREGEVLRLVATGRSNAQIAAELVLSEKTVARHLSNIFGKLDVGSRTAAAAYAFEHGLL